MHQRKWLFGRAYPIETFHDKAIVIILFTGESGFAQTNDQADGIRVGKVDFV